MNSKERQILALDGKKPDRLPVTIHDWQEYHLKNYMNNVGDIKAFEVTGLDAAVIRYPFVWEKSNNWKTEHTQVKKEGYILHKYKITTPKGELSYSQGQNQFTTWDIEHLIKNKEDIELLKYRNSVHFNKKEFETAYTELGDRGIVRTMLCGYQGGCWQEACNLYGTQNLILETFDDASWVIEFLNILLEEKLKFIETSIKGAKIDIVETGGGAGSCTIISPQIHKEFCLPYDKTIHEALNGCNVRSIYHTCGGMMGIAHLILQNGCTASETFSPKDIGGDIKTEEDEREICKVFKGKKGIVGGMDQINILTNKTPKEIEKEVERLWNVYGKDGGFILCASDHFFETPVKNLVAFANCAKQYLY